MQWAVGEGIVNGESETILAPHGKALRAQCAALIMRFFAKNIQNKFFYCHFKVCFLQTLFDFYTAFII
ncbi:MAG: hypothetical protein L6V93_10710 [Clostridiales bacterium]|nr:MAG: hypothetical protein L6V93_10710 [Clostridiales bacterium]